MKFFKRGSAGSAHPARGMLAVALLLAAGARGSDGGLGEISEAIGAVQKYGHLVNIPHIRLKLSK